LIGCATPNEDERDEISTGIIKQQLPSSKLNGLKDEKKEYKQQNAEATLSLDII